MRTSFIDAHRYMQHTCTVMCLWEWKWIFSKAVRLFAGEERRGRVRLRISLIQPAERLFDWSSCHDTLWKYTLSGPLDGPMAIGYYTHLLYVVEWMFAEGRIAFNRQTAAICSHSPHSNKQPCTAKLCLPKRTYSLLQNLLQISFF